MDLNRKFDFLIVGQGLAGSLIAYFLQKKGKKVFVIDDHHRGSSSKIAAGIINPITGRRFVKSWMFDELLAFNRIFYPKLEKEFRADILKKRKVLVFLQKNKDVNEWAMRSAFDGYEKYMCAEADWFFLKDKINEPIGFGEIDHAAQVDMPKLLKLFKGKFERDGFYFIKNVDYEHFVLENKSVRLGSLEAETVIFCEGQRAQKNPFFNYLPFETSKGEILIVKIPALKSTKIIKDKLILAPLGNYLYWCGSNYEWQAKNDLPTEAVKMEFINKLKQELKVDFEVVEHLAAVRPTVKDRRPFIGMHPVIKNLAIFNGLGTKGASLGPYWAKHFVDHLVDGTPLNDEVNISRYSLKGIL